MRVRVPPPLTFIVWCRYSCAVDTTNAVTINQWGVCGKGDGYTPPELSSVVLVGTVHDHPKWPPSEFPEGRRIETSAILNAEGRYVRTRSRVYYLGEPDPTYLAYLEEAGLPFDPENPVTVRCS